MNDIDVLAHKRITGRISKPSYERAVTRISRQAGVSESVISKMIDKACQEHTGKPYDGPTSFGMVWDDK